MDTTTERLPVWNATEVISHVLAVIPETAERVLDLNCRGWEFADAIKRRQKAEVFGITANSDKANQAKSRLDRVLVGSIETIEPVWPDNSLDAIVWLDGLGGVRRPLGVLRKLRGWLRPEGRLITRLATVRHHAVAEALIRGRWVAGGHGPAGVSLRFFTRREIEKLFYRGGFALTDLQAVASDSHNEWVKAGRPNKVHVGGLSLNGMTDLDAEEFFTTHYEAVAVPTRLTAIAGERNVNEEAKARLAKLAEAFPWPAAKPDVPMPRDHLGWMGDSVQQMLARELSAVTRVVVELGAWLGQSTRFIADRAPKATVVTIDHWQGSPEHHRRAEWRAMLPALYSTFLALNWPYSDRIIPVRKTVLEGLQIVSDFGLKPDLIYVDADHRYEAVTDVLNLVDKLFPDATVVGDDYDDDDVGKAVNEFARRNEREVEVTGNGWRAWKLSNAANARGLDVDPRGAGLTSIILVTYNELPYTRQCLDSIRLYTDERYEIIVVDNGSNDGTLEYLRSLPGVHLISNPSNRGFPAAANQGIDAAKGKQILLLNNDTIVTTGWLTRLLRALHSDLRIGLVGPCTNRISGEQQVPVSYSEDLVGMDGFAWDWGTSHDQVREDTDRLVGFCLLIRREVVDKIGVLDEQFGIGNFEDDDYCRRAMNAGFRAVIARDAFIHHFGSRTFRGSGVDFGGLLEKNRQLFEAKWAAVPSRGQAPDPPVPTSSPPPLRSDHELKIADGGGLILVPKKISVSLCMIVRNNAQHIRPCLLSIRAHVDEMIVADTGSTDDTAKIAAELGARVFHFPWCDDFSAARNESLRHARGEWIFWMDSDDFMDEENGRKFDALVRGDHPPNVLGYVMQVHCPGDGPDGMDDIESVDHVKLFRNRRGLGFEGLIHEQVLPSIRHNNGEVAWTDIGVLHRYYDRTPEGQQRKKERDLRLLHKELLQRPDHPFTLFNLGMTYTNIGQPEEGVNYSRRSIAVSGPNDTHVRKAYAWLVQGLMALNRDQEALHACRKGLRLFPQDTELRFREGVVLHAVGRLEEAVGAYQQLFAQRDQLHFGSLNRGLAGPKGRHNLAVVYQDLGDFARAEKEWRLIVAEYPQYRLGWRGLGAIFVRQGRIQEARVLITRLLKDPRLKSEAHFLESRIAQAEGNWGLARQSLELAVAALPEDLLSFAKPVDK